MFWVSSQVLSQEAAAEAVAGDEFLFFEEVLGQTYGVLKSTVKSIQYSGKVGSPHIIAPRLQSKQQLSLFTDLRQVLWRFCRLNLLKVLDSQQ